MRKKQVWRYYCDFCGKGRCQANAIINHEIHCTKNPNRQCGMCAAIEHPTPPIERLKDGLLQGVDILRDAAGGCPACMLAAIRQSGLTSHEVEWDYNAACEQFWKDYQVEQQRQADNEALSEMYGL